jgi:hypothetical protein
MTRQLARIYATVAAVLVLFLAWAVIAADPWSTASASVDPRVTAIHQREVALRHEAVVVRRVVRHRWAVYRVSLARRTHEIALAEKAHQRQLSSARAAAAAAASAAAARSYSAPSVSVVQLPAITVTRSS